MITYHFVFCPKYRQPVFAMPKVKLDLEALFEGECAKRDWHILAFEILPDHLHLMLQVPNTISASRIAQALKGISSKELRQHHPELRGTLRKHLWAARYYCEAIGKTDKDTVKRYIANQERAWIQAHPIRARL